MWRYLIDTNIISEAMKPSPNQAAMDWLAGADQVECCLSVLTIGEVERGIWMQVARGNTAKANALSAWLARVEEDYSGRILGVTRAVVRVWAHLPAHQGEIDALIAATAVAYDLTVVTRNEKDFAHCGLRVLNLWRS